MRITLKALKFGREEKAQIAYKEDEEIPDAEPCKNDVDDIINRLDEEGRFPNHTVPGTHDLSNMGNCVDSSKEGSVEPSPSLRDKLGKCIWDVCFSNSAFDVFQHPVDNHLR